MSESIASSVSLSGLSESTIKNLKKNPNDLAGINKKIKEDACKKFLKERKKFINKEIDSVTHPVTKNQITREDRIEFIADQCIKGFNMRLSSSKSSSSSDKDLGQDPYTIIKHLDLSDIDKILEYPLNTTINRDKHLLTLFTKIIKPKEALKILEKYLNDISVTDGFVVLYRKIRGEIVEKYLPEYSSFMIKSEFKKKIKAKYYGSNFDPPDIKILYDTADELFLNAIIYNDNNKDEEDFKRNVKENYYKYYACEFILVELKDLYSDITHDRAHIRLVRLDKLIEGTINYTDPDASKSFDKSLTWSASPEEPILKATYKTNKETELKRIMDTSNYNGSINDADFYTMDEWKDMSLRKLKSVIVIPYDEGGKQYANAFYIKSLYTAWYMAVKEKKPFLNPSNRKLFSDDDKQKIVTAMKELYPGINEPRYGSTGGRKDVGISYVRDYISGDVVIQIFYMYKDTNSRYTHLDRKSQFVFIDIRFPNSFNFIDDNDNDNDGNVPLGYNPTFLFDMINNLMRQNKILGKNIPFKITESFKKCNNKILTKRQYMTFFDELRMMI